MEQKGAVCAVIPMGGSGKRMLPLSAAISKYLLPVGDLPLVFHAVRELQSAGVSRIILAGQAEVVRSCRAFAQAVGIEDLQYVAIEGATLGNAVTLHHAVPEMIPGSKIVVVYPDDLVSTRYALSPISMLLDATKFYRDDSVFVACREVQKRELKQYGIVKPKGQVFDDSPTRFSEVVEKPEIEEAPSHLAVIGRMLLPYKILQNTYSIFHKSKQIGIEPHIISLINSYVEQNHDGYAVVIQNECYDCGSLAGYRSACRDFSK